MPQNFYLVGLLEPPIQLQAFSIFRRGGLAALGIVRLPETMAMSRLWLEENAGRQIRIFDEDPLGTRPNLMLRPLFIGRLVAPGDDPYEFMIEENSYGLTPDGGPPRALGELNSPARISELSPADLESLFNRGSISIDSILELFNIVETLEEFRDLTARGDSIPRIPPERYTRRSAEPGSFIGVGATQEEAEQNYEAQVRQTYEEELRAIRDAIIDEDEVASWLSTYEDVALSPRTRLDRVREDD